MESEKLMSSYAIELTLDGNKLGLVQSFNMSANMDNPLVSFKYIQLDKAGEISSRQATVKNIKTDENGKTTINLVTMARKQEE